MQFAVFKELLKTNEPPELGLYLKSLWFDAKGEWAKAHDLIDDIQTMDAYWLHGYLHRKEGDLGNAAYWYSKAGKKSPSNPLEQEWNDLVAYFLEKE